MQHFRDSMGNVDTQERERERDRVRKQREKKITGQ